MARCPNLQTPSLSPPMATGGELPQGLRKADGTLCLEPPQRLESGPAGPWAHSGLRQENLDSV